MVAKAKENYPDIDFEVNDALKLPYSNEWDVVFSNAVFHWISDHDLLLKNGKWTGELGKTIFEN